MLSASWSMNVGSGFITKELWVKQDDGRWLLKEDDFSVVTEYDQPREDGDQNDTALIIVDLQNDYFEDGKMPLFEVDAAAGNATKLLEHFRDSNKPIIHIQHIFNDDSAPFFIPHSTGVEIYKSVAPIDSEELVVKAFPNSFKDTSLDSILIEKRN